jgi:hypothetical protein
MVQSPPPVPGLMTKQTIRWEKTPAVITAVAAVIGALAALTTILFQLGYLSSNSTARWDTHRQLSTPDQIQTVTELFRQYELFGEWAHDCTKPLSDKNHYVDVINPSSGPIIESHRFGPHWAPNNYIILSARAVSADVISVRTVVWPGTKEQEINDLVFLVGGDTRRTISNQPEGKALRVQRGIQPDNRETPTLYKCIR